MARKVSLSKSSKARKRIIEGYYVTHNFCTDDNGVNYVSLCLTNFKSFYPRWYHFYEDCFFYNVIRDFDNESGLEYGTCITLCSDNSYSIDFTRSAYDHFSSMMKGVIYERKNSRF